MTNCQAKLTLGWKTKGLLKNEKGNSASGHRSPDLMENTHKKKQFYSAEVAESRRGFSLFNDCEAVGKGWGLRNAIQGYDRRCLWIVFKRGVVYVCVGWGWRAVWYCAGWKRGSPSLPHFLSSVSSAGLLRCVCPPTPWHWKKAGQALALLVNEALTSLAHTHKHTHCKQCD